MTKTKEIGPPTLITPANMLPIFAAKGDTSQVDFTWTPMDNIRTYHVRVSKDTYFRKLVLDKEVPAPQLTLSGLTEGAYYWAVQAVDAKGRESLESDHNKFTIVPKSSEVGLALELDPFVQHGHVIEVRGKTDPSARVMVNGEEVPVIGSDGSFRYYTQPLPQGENVITVTAQNQKGGVSTQTKKLVVQ
jgi:hypothetical protein